MPPDWRRKGRAQRYPFLQAAKQDKALIANIARAHQWLDRIKAGQTIHQIAKGEHTTKKRVQQTLNYAFLAPDIVRDILAGQQPIGLTSTWIATHELPVNWNEQRSLIATL